MLVVSLWWFKLSSSDLGYHLAYGRHFLETGRIVTLDPFLEPSIARPFINANWGAQVLFALVERMGGAVGLILCRWALLAVVFSSMAIVVRRAGCGWHGVAWAWMLAALAAYERFTLRPELFSYAIMMVMVGVLVGRAYSWRSVAILGVLQIVWVNMHSYFLVGPILTGSMLAGELLQRLSATRSSEYRPAPSRRTRILAWAFAAQGAACLVNPWHVRGAMFPLQTLRYLQEQKVIGADGVPQDAGPWSIVSEFQQPFRFLFSPINNHTIEAYCILLPVAFLGLVALLVHRRWGEGLVIAFLLAMSLQMRRNIAQFAIVAAPLAVCGLASAVPNGWSSRRAGRWARRVWVIATILAASVGTWTIVEGRFYHAERRLNREPGMGYSARINLIDAARWLSAQGAVQPGLFVDFFSSSNVLPWLDPRFKLLIDTNTFGYDDQWLTQIIAVGEARRPHREFFDRYHINAALLHVGTQTAPLVRALHADGDWALVYVDPHAVVFLRRIGGHASIIGAYQPASHDLDIEAWMNSARGPRHHRAASLVTMAAVPLTLGWHERAARLFEEALRCAPDSADAWNNLGLCHWEQAKGRDPGGQTETAESHLRESQRCFKKAVTLQPNEPLFRKNLSLVNEALRPPS